MRNRARALAVMIAVLLVGLTLGIAGHHFWELRFRERVPVSSRPQVQRQTDTLAKRLQLNTVQEAQLKAILEDSRLQINTGRKELEFKMEAIRARTNEKIAGILNDEQKKKFQQFLTEVETRRGHGEGRGGHRQEHRTDNVPSN